LVTTQTDLAVDQQNCLPTAYSGQRLEYVTEERRRTAPHRPASQIAVADRSTNSRLD
jgi:hypothetical protein